MLVPPTPGEATELAGSSGARSGCRISAARIDDYTAFMGARTAALYRWWTLNAGSDVPSRARFDILDHPTLAPYIFLVEAQADGAFLIKLSGENVVAILGHNPTGGMVTASDPWERFGHKLHAHYSSVVKHRAPHLCSGDLAHAARGFVRFESIDCPLKSDGSDSISHIIGVIEQIRGAP